MNEFDYKLLGLEPRDIKVYEALYSLENGSLRAIAESTKFNRGTVYEIIKKLTSMGLVTFKQVGRRRYFQAADPGEFAALLREKSDQLRQAEKGAQEYVKALRSQASWVQDVHFASFYEGFEGVAAILRDVLNVVRGLEVKQYRTISTPKVSEFLYTNFPNFNRQRRQENIFVKVIALCPPTEPVEVAERRQLPPTRDGVQKSYTLIYGDKTALISLSDSNMPFGVVLDDVNITDLQKLIFDQLWESLSPINVQPRQRTWLA